MNTKPLHLLFFILLLASASPLFAQNNLDKLMSKVEAGKTYALYKARKSDTATFTAAKKFYLKVIPPKYKVVYDTIVIAPALNGNLDTSNYFIQTEVLVLKEPGVAWKTAKVHSLCRDDKSTPAVALCLLKTTPEYKIIHRKFFPFKNILDTTTTDYIIPAQLKVIERKELIQETQIQRISADRKDELAPNEKLVSVKAGTWKEWDEVVCPFGEFNDPDIKDVQAALKKEAYKVNITGNFDPQTKEALHRFQADNLLEVGELTPETLERLGIRREPLISIEN